MLHELISQHKDIISAILKKTLIGTASDFPEKNEFISLMCEKIGKNKNGLLM